VTRIVVEDDEVPVVVPGLDVVLVFGSVTFEGSGVGVAGVSGAGVAAGVLSPFGPGTEKPVLP
jgi:hypothetical protein